MSVMRVEKNSNYTVMANYHLKDKGISLKAKGLLSVMLSLPSEWDYTLAGLAYISKEGVDAIRTAIKELEQAGYVVRTRNRNDAGQLLDADYTIYELPQVAGKDEADEHGRMTTFAPPASEKPILENPILDHPAEDIPPQEKPILEKPTQLNTEEEKKKEIKTDISNPYQSNTYLSIPEAERHPMPVSESHTVAVQNSTWTDHPNAPTWTGERAGQQISRSEATHLSDQRSKFSYDELVQRIKNQIDYWDWMDDNNKAEIDNILSIMVEVLSTKCECFTISGKQYPADLVYQRFHQINSNTIEYVLECFHKCGSDIRNIKQYLIAALFNAPATYDSYYGAAVRRDYDFLRQ